MMRLWKWIIPTIAGYLLLSAVAGMLLCDMALNPGRKPLSNQAQSAAVDLAHRYDAVLQDAAILQQDGSECSGWYFRNPRGYSGRAVLVLHGLSDNRSGMMGYIELFLANGYSVLAPDSRRHGESGGSIATYGLLERHDVFRWAKWMQQRAPADSIFALGESMGGAILLQSLQTVPPFRAVVVEASFSNFTEIGCDRISQKLNMPLSVGRIVFRPAVDAGLIRGRQKYGMDFSSVAPEQVCAGPVVPILLIHSEADTNIPFRHALRILNACGGRIEFWRVPDGGHASTLGKHREEFTRRVLQFFDTHR